MRSFVSNKAKLNTRPQRREGKKSVKQLSFSHLTSIQMISSGICGSDDHVLKGELLVNFPLIPGHEGAGIVESVGDGVRSVKPGRKWEACQGTPDPGGGTACTVSIFSRKTSWVCL